MKKKDEKTSNVNAGSVLKHQEKMRRWDEKKRLNDEMKKRLNDEMKKKTEWWNEKKDWMMKWDENSSDVKDEMKIV